MQDKTTSHANEPFSPETGVADIGLLAFDHPGAADPAYRARRDAITRLARDGRARGVIPVIDYTADEHATWRHIATLLEERHARKASGRYLAAKRALGIRTDAIPQLIDLDRRLRGFHGFGLAPVEGLIDSRTFLGTLSRGTMLCTQYIRHASKPEYTPEPDIVHEVIGHVPTFTDGEFVDFTRLVGRAALRATPDQLVALERLYWYTVEFGLIEEADGIKAFGAGLLSSLGELAHAFSPDVERRPFSLSGVVATPYDYSRMQETLFVIPSFSALRAAAEALVDSF